MDGFAPVFSSRSFEDEEDEDNLCDHVDASLDGFATSGDRPLTDNKRWVTIILDYFTRSFVFGCRFSFVLTACLGIDRKALI